MVRFLRVEVINALRLDVLIDMPLLVKMFHNMDSRLRSSKQLSFYESSFLSQNDNIYHTHILMLFFMV